MLALRDIVIDPEFESLIPPMTDEERTQLMVNIQRDGFREPLVVWMNQAILLDGHNRYRIWQDCFQDEDGREPDVLEMPFKSRDDAKLWMIRNQLGRRNLLPAVRVQLGLQLKPALEAKAKENIKAAQESSPKREGKAPLISAEPLEVRAEIAKAAGVGKDTVRKVEAVLKFGDEATKKAMLSGEKKINAAFKETKQRTSEPAEPIQKVITAPVLVGEFVAAISLGLKRLRDKHHAHGVEFDAKLVRKMAFNYLEGAL